MAKYTFICKHSSSDDVTVNTEADTLFDVIQSFEQFLRGAGFYFEGSLDIVQEEESISSTSEDDCFADFPLSGGNEYDYSNIQLSDISLSNIDFNADISAIDTFASDWNNISLSSEGDTFVVNAAAAQATYNLDDMSKQWPFPTERP